MSVLVRIFILFLVSFFYTIPLLNAEIITYHFPYWIHHTKKIAYKDGAIYYISQKNTYGNFGLYEVKNERVTLIKEIFAEVSSPPVINDNGDIYFSTFKNGNLELNCINPNSAKEWSFRTYCDSNNIFTPLVINESNIFLQTTCGSIFIITSYGQKLKEIHSLGRLSRQPVKIDKNKVLTGNNSKIYLLDVSDLLPPPCGIIPEDPPILPPPTPGIIPNPDKPEPNKFEGKNNHENTKK